MRRVLGYTLLGFCWLLRGLHYILHPAEMAYVIETRWVCKLLGHAYIPEDATELCGVMVNWCDRCTAYNPKTFPGKSKNPDFIS